MTLPFSSLGPQGLGSVRVVLESCVTQRDGSSNMSQVQKCRGKKGYVEDGNLLLTYQVVVVSIFI